MIIPKIKFEGCDFANQATRIYIENVFDLYSKVEQGQDPDYDIGFFHTSGRNHEGTCYYTDMWSRDSGRGLIELCRLGFREEALLVARYAINHLDGKDHWFRLIHSPNSNQVQDKYYMKNELDGNAIILLGIYNTWRINGKTRELAQEIFEKIQPVINWIKTSMAESPYEGLMPCASELSGNPNAHYLVYAIYPNYGIKAALLALAKMAGSGGFETLAAELSVLYEQMSLALNKYLVSGMSFDGNGMAFFEDISPVPKGCWINAIDGRDGREYLFSEWGGTSWPIYHWTRQLPYILDSDTGFLEIPDDGLSKINYDSYEYILNHMENSEYFRKYGFVSSTGWTGTGGRHDDTMCGYGHGFMMQAALMADDINVYSRLAEGLVRLAYDGNVTKPLSFEISPWVFHECFNYENYDKGFDHTFGQLCNGRFGIMENDGDEGNLVQQAECVKAMLLMAGINDHDPSCLKIMPRIPWDWDKIQVEDYPYINAEGQMQRLSFTMEHHRWQRKTAVSIKSTGFIPVVNIRLGPFPNYTGYRETENTRIEKTKGGTWIWVEGLSGMEIDYTLEL